MRVWLNKLKESALSILPVYLVVMVVYILDQTIYDKIIKPVDVVLFTIATVLLILGMWLFNIGSEGSMAKLGEHVGATLTRKKNIALLAIITFLVGVLITVAEPDLTALANQVPIDNTILIVVIGVGVGIFLVVGALRIVFQKNLKLWLLAFYGLLFAVACLLDEEFIPISFDSGGVTTGPITVPFILAFGVGIATSRASSKSNADSFGLVAFASVGPILMVLILAFVLQTQGITFSTGIEQLHLNEYSDMWPILGESYQASSLNVLIAIAPIFAFFLIFNLIFIKLPRKALLKIVIALIYTYLGLVLFLGAVEAGFMNMGYKIAEILGTDESTFYLLLIFGAILGVAAIFAEPAVHVLTAQVEQVSSGAIKSNVVMIALAAGNGLAIILALLRVKYQFPLMYYLVPGYVFAFLLSFLVPDIYSAIAFDSGGVVSGPMNSTFLVPIATGFASIILTQSGQIDVGTGIMKYGFGMIALVALMPLISIQLIGFIAGIRTKVQYKRARLSIRDEFDNQIIHFE